MRALSLVTAALLCVTGCWSPPDATPWPATPGAWAWLLLVDEANQAIEITELEPTDPARFGYWDESVDALLLEVPEAALEKLYPELAVDQRPLLDWSAQLGGNEACALEVRGLGFELHPPPESRLSRLDRLGGTTPDDRPLAHARLRVARAESRCVAPSSAAFAHTAIIAEAPLNQNFDVEWVDETTALVAQTERLLLVSKGERIPAEGGRAVLRDVIEGADVEPGTWLYRGAVRGQGDQWWAWANHKGGQFAAVIEVEIGQGQLRYVRTATVLDNAEIQMLAHNDDDLVIGTADGLVVLGMDGSYERCHEGIEFRASLIVDDAEGQIMWLGGSSANMLSFHYGTSPCRIAVDQPLRDRVSSHIQSFLFLDGELWVFTRENGVHRRTDEGDWEEASLAPIQAAEACSAPPNDCGLLRAPAKYRAAVASADGPAVLVPDVCLGALWMEPARNCLAPLSFLGRFENRGGQMRPEVLIDAAAGRGSAFIIGKYELAEVEL